MKKTATTVAFIVMAAAVSEVAFAGDDIKVASGDASVLMQSGKAYVEFDYSKTMVVEYDGKKIDKKEKQQKLADYLKSRGDDFVRDWEKDQPDAYRFMYAQIRKLGKKGGLEFDKEDITNSTNADYKLRVVVDYLDWGNSAAAIVSWGVGFMSSKAGGMVMSGKVEVVNVRTGKVECVIDVPFLKTQSGETDTMRLRSLYMELGKAIVSIAKKAK